MFQHWNHSNIPDWIKREAVPLLYNKKEQYCDFLQNHPNNNNLSLNNLPQNIAATDSEHK